MDEEEEGQIDCYKVDVNFWVIYDPEVNYKVIDDFYINSIEKNGEELEFILQKDIPEELKTEILNQLEYEV